MTLLKLKAMCVVAMAVGLTGGGFGLYAIHADEKKPQPVPGEVKKPAPGDPVKKPAPADPAKPGEKPAAKPAPDGEKPKPAPDGEKPKPEKPAGAKFGGKVASVDAKENTITLATKTDSGVVDKVFPVAPDAKVFIDNKDAKLADVPKNSTAAFVAAPTKEGKQPLITELRVTGSVISGIIKEVSATDLALENEKKPQAFKVSADTKVTVNEKDAKATDLKAGDKVVVTLKADESAALLVVAGAKVPDGEKPGVKNPKFGGKVADVDRTTRTVWLTGKGVLPAAQAPTVQNGVKPPAVQNGTAGAVTPAPQIPVKLTADAKIIVDGIEKKIGDIPKGALATFNLVAAKDGQPREANEIVVAGPTFTGLVKQIDATSVTVGTEKNDRVVKLAFGGKVLVGEKEGKLADLKVGDKVSVTLTSDESAAVQIQGGGVKKPGDKPKPEKEEEDE